jgi:hypothetical protein
MPTIADQFVPVLLDTAGVRNLLEEQCVEPERYILYMYARQRALARRAGMAITAVFVVVFFALGYSAALNIPDVSAPVVGLIAAFLGLAIGVGALKYQEGWRLPYTNNPDNQSRGFLALGLLNSFSFKYMKRLTPTRWEAIRQAKIDPGDKRFAVPFPEERHAAKLKSVSRLSPRQERLAVALERAQRWSAWSVLVVVLMFFTEGYFFAYLAWTAGSVWFFLEGLVGWIRKKVAAFDVETVEIYGWPARIVSVVIMLTAAAFIASGVLGMVSELTQ